MDCLNNEIHEYRSDFMNIDETTNSILETGRFSPGSEVVTQGRTLKR